MGAQKRVLALILIMVLVCMIVSGIMIAMLYNTEINEQRFRLVETAQSQARLIEAIARFDAVYSQKDNPEGSIGATLSQIKDAHSRYKSFSQTGAFTLASRDGEQIKYWLRHRLNDTDSPKPVPFYSEFEEPMRRALSGQSGTMIGPDDRGKIVLSAYEPIAVLNMGIVVKIDLAEIQAPFIRACVIAGALMIIVVSCGAMLFIWISNPIIRRLTEHAKHMEQEVESRTLELSGANAVMKQEIKEREHAEKALRNSEQRWRNILVNTPRMCVALDPQFKIIFVNKQFIKLTGWEEGEIIGQNFSDVFIPEPFRAEIQKNFHAFISRKNALDLSNFENDILTKSGELLNVAWANVINQDAAGNVTDVISLGVDLTERKKAEAALRSSEVKFRSMMEAITDSIYICSPEFTVEYMNPAMIKRLGRDATGETCHGGLYGLDHRCDWCSFDNMKKGKIMEATITSPLDDRTYRVTMMPIQNQNGTVSKMSIFRDMTDFLAAIADKDKAQSQLLQSQKMEAIGTLAGGIAHDFNNILYPIIGFAELSLEELPENHSVKENLEDILQGAKRARDLVKQFLAFSSQREEEQKILVLSPLIREVLEFLRSAIPSNIDIQQELYDTSDCVLASPIEIHEIVMNLCTNAYHAMQETGGVLSIRLNKAAPDPKLNLSHGDYCCLSISDTGSGIPHEIINNIFNPYFTTKALGKGTGLGLSVVHGIIQKYHGAILVESEPGKGTVFKIYLPITSAIKKPAETSGDKPSLGGNERILFVDDEVPIVKLGIRLLEKLGYTVTGKNSSIEALALFKSAPDDFDLVITDMAMPQMVGTEFAAKLIETRPDIPVIICTGFSDNVKLETAQLLGIRDYLRKPILSADLYSKVRAVLDQSQKGE